MIRSLISQSKLTKPRDALYFRDSCFDQVQAAIGPFLKDLNRETPPEEIIGAFRKLAETVSAAKVIKNSAAKVIQKAWKDREAKTPGKKRLIAKRAVSIKTAEIEM